MILSCQSFWRRKERSFSEPLPISFGRKPTEQPPAGSPGTSWDPRSHAHGRLGKIGNSWEILVIFVEGATVFPAVETGLLI